ncbi:MAG: hypothetical protein KAJ30_01315, partial [Candidatus Heimdallarchaeota archaeon]|nr:hypothetical protein [Candidatus Heimdallarchaeota archaeon]
KEKFSKTVVKEIGKSMEKEEGDFNWVTDEMKEKFTNFIEKEGLKEKFFKAIEKEMGKKK